MTFKPLPKAYWRATRDEAMRRARNAMFYAVAPGITDGARASWRSVAADRVRDARGANWAALGAP